MKPACSSVGHVKVKLCLRLMKAYEELELYCQAGVLDFGTTWMGEVSLATRPFNPRGKNIRFSLDMRLGGLEAGVDAVPLP
jgi:hypothetical protein